LSHLSLLVVTEANQNKERNKMDNIISETKYNTLLNIVEQMEAMLKNKSQISFNIDHHAFNSIKTALDAVSPQKHCNHDEGEA